MKVFLSWSGEVSHRVAEVLRRWIPQLLLGEVKMVTAGDLIEPGSRWSDSLLGVFREVDFAIICVTPENLHAPWLLYEIGALAARTDSIPIVPFLIDVSPQDLRGPLAQYQAVVATAEGTQQLLQSLRAKKERQVPSAEVSLQALHDMWPDIERELLEHLHPRPLPLESLDSRAEVTLEFPRSLH